VRKQLECTELCLGADEERVERLWARIIGQAHMGDTVVSSLEIFKTGLGKVLCSLL